MTAEEETRLRALEGVVIGTLANLHHAKERWIAGNVTWAFVKDAAERWLAADIELSVFVRTLGKTGA